MKAPAGQEGSGSVLVLAVFTVLVAGALALAVLVQAVVARHAVETAADLGALAAADLEAVGDPAACAAAARVVAAHGSAVTSCVVHGDGSVQVSAVRRPSGELAELAALGPARAGARAGRPP